MSGDLAEPIPDVERSIGYATPRTDAATKWDHERYVDERGMVASVKVVRAEFAAQLERELAAAKAATRSEMTPVDPVAAVRFPCSICGKPADGHSHTFHATTTLPDPGTEKLLRTLLDRAYKMMLQAGYRVMEHDPDQNDPIGAWMSDARAVLYGSGRQPDLGSLT